MKCLHIQLQSELCACDVEPIVDELTSIATDAVSDAVVAVERGDDDGPYININIQTDVVATLWTSMSHTYRPIRTLHLARSSAVRATTDGTITCCCITMTAMNRLMYCRDGVFSREFSVA